MSRRSAVRGACAALLLLLVSPSNAHAVDKRLRLMFRLAGYGAGLGTVVGAASVVAGAGGIKNAFMGASAGMYAGILLAGYIVATANEDKPERREGERGNPYAPRAPIGTEGDEEDPDTIREMLPDYDGRVGIPPDAVAALERRDVFELAVWVPVVSVSF